MAQLHRITAPARWKAALIRGDKELSPIVADPGEADRYQQLMEMLGQNGWKISFVAGDNEGGEQQPRSDGHDDVLDYIAEWLQ